MGNKTFNIFIVFILTAIILTSMANSASYDKPKAIANGTGYKKVCVMIETSVDILNRSSEPISEIVFENESNFNYPREILTVIVTAKSSPDNISLNGSSVTLEANGGKFLATNNLTTVGELNATGFFAAEWRPLNKTIGAYEFKAEIVRDNYCGICIKKLNATLAKELDIQSGLVPMKIDRHLQADMVKARSD
jgi:hypothetical protein